MRHEGNVTMIEVRVYELMQEKFGPNEKMWPTRDTLAKELEMQSATVTSWLKKRVDRVELDTLDKWCRYFDVEPGKILVRVDDL